MSEESPSIGIVSLGCPKATVDTETIITRLRAEGYNLSASYQGSDVVIINTCGFINEAIDESMQAIGEAVEENGRVIVTGCLGKNSALIQDSYPDVLAITGPADLAGVMQAVHSVVPPPHDPFQSLVPPHGLHLTPSHYAYLKISEGCNHKCSFCIIPSLRGGLVSRRPGDVLQDAERLVEAGVKELLVISQDTSAYGVDLKYCPDFFGQRPVRSHITDLSRALGDLGAWVRLLYVYPYPHVDELIPLMADGFLVPYLDMPLQHASRRILKAMRRPASSENVLERIGRWRETCPDITLRSTFIVGFPGETEDDFLQLLDFIEAAQLDRVGCFTYSPVAGASANELPGMVPDEVKLERQQRFMEAQARISADKLASKIGSMVDVLIDGITEEGAIGRSISDAPEIDGCVLIGPEADCSIGDLVQVKITGSSDHDLYGIVDGASSDR
jgi:ribosomal protein S12 methylthiotransferase